MERSFISAIADLRHADIDTMISRLHELYANISQMSPEQAIAAFQTVRTVAEESGFTDDPMMKRVGTAILVRMAGLIATTSCSRNMANWFETATGYNFSDPAGYRLDMREPFKLQATNGVIA